jgi:arylsulfatase A-like enzyme
MGAKFGAGTPLKLDAFSHILPTVCDRAIEKIGELAKTGKPFFIYCAPCAPHDPYVPTKEWKGRSGLGDYADYVMETDAEIGRVLDALEKTGQASNTLFVLTSDNGCAPYAGAKGMEAKGHYPSAQFRGYKSDIWDGGHRIPFIVRWPGVVKPGSTCGQMVCEMDFMATCAEITGAKLPENAAEDSVSLLPLLKGKDQPVRSALVHHSYDGNFAIREGKWKLIFCPGSGGWGVPNAAAARKQKLPEVQLYDMTGDEGEQANLQGEHPDIVKRLTANLEKIVADGRSTPGPKLKNDVPVNIKKSKPSPDANKD